MKNRPKFPEGYKKKLSAQKLQSDLLKIINDAYPTLNLTSDNLRSYLSVEPYQVDYPDAFDNINLSQEDFVYNVDVSLNEGDIGSDLFEASNDIVNMVSEKLKEYNLYIRVFDWGGDSCDGDAIDECTFYISNKNLNEFYKEVKRGELPYSEDIKDWHR